MNTKPLTKTERFELRLTPEQKQRLKELAAASNMTLSDYIVTKLQLD
jgi:uncharacterized protein (DUF1778 family)